MQRVNANPKDMKAWLDLIMHQDTLSFAKPILRIEKKLSIVESAMKHNDNQTLLLLYLTY